MNTMRIPDFSTKTRWGMARWFSEMALRDLLFHPEDKPSDIVSSATGEPLFNRDECEKLEWIQGEMFRRFGDDVCEIAYPIFMKATGLPVASHLHHE